MKFNLKHKAFQSDVRDPFGNPGGALISMTLWTIRRAALAILLLVVVASGCAGGKSGGASTPTRTSSSKRTQNSESTLATDVDPAKARMPLEKIPDAPVKPVAPNNLTPLSERASKQLATANTLIGDQRYTEAAIELERALRFEPNHPDIQRALAALHWQAGNIERARTHAGKAIEGNPDRAMPHYILAQCAMRSSDVAAAMKEYRTALLCSDARPDSEVAMLTHYHLAESLVSLGYLEAALREYDLFEKSTKSLKGNSLSTEASLLVQSSGSQGGEAKANVLERLGRVAEAADALAPVVATHPDDAARLKHYAELLMRAGRFDDALNSVRSIPSDDPEIIVLSYRIYDAAGRLNELVNDLQRRVESRPDDSRLALSLVDVLVRMKNPREANEVMRGFLAKHPDSDEVRTRLLAMLIQQSEWSAAKTLVAEDIDHHLENAGKIERVLVDAIPKDQAAELLKSEKANPADFAQCYVLGRLALAAGQQREAEAYFSASIAAKADFAAGRAALGQLFVDQYRYDDATRVVAIDDDTITSIDWLEQVRGVLLERLDKLDQAEAHLRRATVLNRADTESMLLLAQIYRRSNRVLQAQRQLRVLLDQDRKNEAAHELLALTYVNERKRDAAVEETEELRRVSSNPCTIARCNAFLDPQLNSDPEARRTALLKAIETGPADAATWLAVADTYDDDQPEKQRDAYQNALKLDPNNEDAAFGVIRTEEALLRYEDAAVQLNELLKRRPNRQPWRQALIRLYWVINDFNRALAIATEQEAQADAGSTTKNEFRRAIIATLNQAGQGNLLVEQLRKWIDESPDDHDFSWRDSLVDAYISNDQPAQAVIAAEELYKLSPHEPGVREDVVQALHAAKRHERAMQYALEWVDEDPDNDQAVMYLIMELAASNRLDDAIEIARRRLLQTSKREVYQNRIVAHLAVAKRHAECIEYLESLVDEAASLFRTMGEGGHRPMERASDEELARRPNEPWAPESLQNRIFFLRHQIAAEMIADRRFREAELALTQWLQGITNPDLRAEFLTDLSTCYREQGNEEQTSRVLEEAHSTASQNSRRAVSIGNDLAYLWIDRGERLNEAEPLIRSAVARDPLQAAYLDTYGWLLYKRSAFEEARKWLSRGFNGYRVGPLHGKDPVIQDHLGDCLWRLKDAAGAIEHWIEAVRLAEQRKDEEFVNDDEKRVRDVTPKKIEAAKSGGDVPVASLAEKQ
ncbi:MAG: tetratricopeptide repeat protein [Planctomycetes bacterium]|nr:tetratricopeptide repeat protein [Planctomycetota bacterium]